MMTDLSTTNLKHLLAEATPGPWEYKLENGYIMSDLVETLNGWIQTNDGETVLGTGLEISDEQELRNLALAAAAPELAQEVLRMRKGLQAIRSDLHETTLCDGGTTGPYLQGATAQAAATIKQIDQILGDHDE
ncbi:hypothetical protein ACUY29_12270 [Corynebacterium aurimucosum]